jgi:ketosteroid isomerase-like protein
MKIRILAIVGFVIGFAMPALAQEQNTVDPEVRQQIEAALTNFDEAYKKHDAAAIAALFTQDAIQVWAWETAGGVASGQQAIKKRFEAELAATPSITRKLVQVYPIGDEICAISRASVGRDPWNCVTIYVLELDEWKIRMEYWNGRQ